VASDDSWRLLVCILSSRSAEPLLTYLEVTGECIEKVIGLLTQHRLMRKVFACLTFVCLFDLDVGKGRVVEEPLVNQYGALNELAWLAWTTYPVRDRFDSDMLRTL